jgi:hypothetical protein
MRIDRATLAALYLDWVNNYATLDIFAEHHGLTPDEAAYLLQAAESCHTNPHPEA